LIPLFAQAFRFRKSNAKRFLYFSIAYIIGEKKMKRNDKMSIWQVLALYIMSLFIYIIVIYIVSGTSISTFADIFLGSLVIGESIIVIIILIRDILDNKS